MPSEQFSRSVRGSSGQAIATNASGTVETDNYTEGGSFSGSPPANVNPSETIQEIVITTSGSDSTMTLTTISGTKFTVNLNGGTLALDTVQVDTIGFGGTSVIEGNWVGE